MRPAMVLVLGLAVAPAIAGQVVTPDAMAVYRSVLEDPRCSGTPGIPRGTVPMVRHEGVSPRQGLWAERSEAEIRDVLRRGLPDVDASLLDTFAADVTEPSFDADLVRELGAIPIGQADIDRIGAQHPTAFEFWDALFREFPSASALVRLSAVAVDAAAMEALVYCDYAVSPLGGLGSVVWLRRSGDGWQPVVWHVLWIS